MLVFFTAFVLTLLTPANCAPITVTLLVNIPSVVWAKYKQAINNKIAAHITNHIAIFGLFDSAEIVI